VSPFQYIVLLVGSNDVYDANLRPQCFVEDLFISHGLSWQNVVFSTSIRGKWTRYSCNDSLKAYARVDAVNEHLQGCCHINELIVYVFFINVLYFMYSIQPHGCHTNEMSVIYC
jgi:hypothetical protein